MASITSFQPGGYPGRLYGTFSHAGTTSASITGTIFGATEADIVAGGKTIIITLTNDTFVAAGAAFNAQRQAILDGIATTHGILTDNQPVTTVARTSDTVATITLDADPAYDILSTDTGEVTVPAAALTGAVAIVGSPTFSITAVAPPTPPSDTPDGAGNLDWLNKGPGRKKRKSRVIRFSDFETREAYEKALQEAASALAAQAIPVSRISETGAVEDDDLEDDEAILMALMRILH